MPFDINNFIVKQYICKKTGKKKPQRWYMHYCDRCGAKRSYMPKNRTTSCASCSAKGKVISNEQKSKISKALKGNKNFLSHTVQSRSLAGKRGSITKKQKYSKEYLSNLHGAAKMNMSLSEYSLIKKDILVRRRLAKNIRSNIYNCLKNKTGQLRHVDWSIEDLKKHLESKFQAGMSWDNYGRKLNKTRCWEVDHIVPINYKKDGEYFYKNLDDPNSESFKHCWSLDNLQPMWADENNSKNNKLLEKDAYELHFN